MTGLFTVSIPDIDFPISIKDIYSDNVSYITKNKNEVKMELFKYLPYCKTKFIGPQIQFIMNMMNISPDSYFDMEIFSKSQFTSTKAVKKWINTKYPMKVDLNWISEKHLRECVFHYYWNNYYKSELNYKDMYYLMIKLNAFLSTPREVDYFDNMITFDKDYSNYNINYFYQE